MLPQCDGGGLGGDDGTLGAGDGGALGALGAGLGVGDGGEVGAGFGD